MAFSFGRTYNSNNSATGAMGLGWTDDYEFNLDLSVSQSFISANVGDGQQILFVNNGDGTYGTPAGITATLTAVTGGFDFRSQDQRVYHFDTNGRLLSIANEDGDNEQLVYSGTQLASVTTDTGASVSFTYNGAGKLTGVSLPDGRSLAYGYTTDSGGHVLLTSYTDLRGKGWSYQYDSSGRLTKISDPNGNDEVTNTYASSGRVSQQLDQLGNKTAFSWDSTHGVSTMIDATGHSWYDSYQGNVLERSTQPSGVIDHAWDTTAYPTSVTDPNGNTSTMTYDGRGNVLTSTAPASLNYTRSFTYDGGNHLLSQTDANGNTTSYTYDANGNVLTVAQPGGGVETMTYDSSGRMLTGTDFDGHASTYTYDANGNRTSVTDPLGNKTTNAYDPRGYLTSSVDPRGNVAGANPADYTTSYTYDADGNQLTMSDPAGRTTTSTYDDDGNLKTRLDPNGHTTTYSYDKADELTSTKAADNSTTTNEYDVRGQLDKVTDGNGNATTYGYDGAGRMTSMTDPRAMSVAPTRRTSPPRINTTPMATRSRRVMQWATVRLTPMTR